MIVVDQFLDILNNKITDISPLLTKTLYKFGDDNIVEVDHNSNKMTIRIPGNNEISRYELVYDPDMNWIVYSETIPRKFKNLICSNYSRFYFKQINTKIYEYFTNDALSTINKLHETLVIDLLIER